MLRTRWTFALTLPVSIRLSEGTEMSSSAAASSMLIRACSRSRRSVDATRSRGTIGLNRYSTARLPLVVVTVRTVTDTIRIP
ncbi:hypothetical protein GTS_54060 [Gandjariella thermophila]|uniref:Uncharacterized protein n=1 Tax=Gandjariella thermophila TaxID=1931992 RepID=A0A4D4JIQ7_9PSEU|nr:hypothetical protein GTS_54060 [Gandjariella thermophila]